MVHTARDGEKRRSSQNSRNHSTRIIGQDEKFRQNKAPHVDRLLDPRSGLSLTHAAKGNVYARLELVDQLNTEEVSVELVEATLDFILELRILPPQITFTRAV